MSITKEERVKNLFNHTEGWIDGAKTWHCQVVDDLDDLSDFVPIYARVEIALCQLVQALYIAQTNGIEHDRKEVIKQDA